MFLKQIISSHPNPDPGGAHSNSGSVTLSIYSKQI